MTLQVYIYDKAMGQKNGSGDKYHCILRCNPSCENLTQHAVTLYVQSDRQSIEWVISL